MVHYWLRAVQIAVVLSCSQDVALLSGYGTQVDRGGSFTPAVRTSAQFPQFPSISEAIFVWESDSESLGTYTFVHTFTISTWLISRITKVTLWIAVDDTYVARMNGHTVGSGPYFVVGEYDVPISWLVGANSTHYIANKLEMDVTNDLVYGGLQYKLLVQTTS